MLSSCATPGFIPVKTEYKVVKPDAAYLQCSLTTALPDFRTLKDSEIANLINNIYSDNKTCYNNMMALKQFYRATDQIFNTKPQ